MPATLIAAAALAGCGGSSRHTATTAVTLPARSAATGASGASGPATATTPGLVVHLKTPATPPRVNVLWPIAVTARTASGQGVNATVSYAFMFGRAVVATRPGGHMSGGVFHDKLLFPPQAVGIPLTLRVQIAGKGVTAHVDHPVTVRR